MMYQVFENESYFQHHPQSIPQHLHQITNKLHSPLYDYVYCVLYRLFLNSYSNIPHLTIFNSHIYCQQLHLTYQYHLCSIKIIPLHPFSLLLISFPILFQFHSRHHLILLFWSILIQWIVGLFLIIVFERSYLRFLCRLESIYF